MLTSKDFYLLYQIILGVFCFFTFFSLFFNIKNNKNDINPVYSLFNFVLSIIVIFIIGLFPIEEGGDKFNYLGYFENNNIFKINNDVGWSYYIYILKLVTVNPIYFFFITSFLYFYGYYLFYKKIVYKIHIYYFLLSTIGSLGFLGYGVNTIRSGLALSLFLIALSKNDKKIWFIVFTILSISIHKSMLILLTALIISKLFSKTKIFLLVWILFFFISFLNINFFTDILTNLFFDVDDRVLTYINSDTNDYYKTGFRFDFLFFSIVPIIFGYYFIYKLNFKNKIYINLFNIYLIVNSLWLLVIRIPFNDRFAYLSWFLQPFILLFPLFYFHNLKNRQLKVLFTIACIISLNIILINLKL